MDLQNKKGAFKYVAIRTWILDNIENYVFKHGEKLPSENLLCKKFAISRQTVRNAFEDLEKSGIVRRVKGSGTYVAKSLKEKRTKTIGVLTSYINGYIFPSVLQGIEETFSSKGFGMDLGITYNKVEAERRFLERMMDANISGLLVEGSKTALPSPNIGLYKEFIRREIPLVFIHNFYPELLYKCPSILMDDKQCSKKITEYLIKKGHVDIAGFFKYDDIQGFRRYEGYLQALLEANIPINEEIIGWFSTSTQDALFNWNNYPVLENINKCTAIVCYNDQMASKMYNYFYENGIKIPDDISMVGYDDAFDNPMTRLELTTVKHPKKELGRYAANVLMEMLEHGVNSVPAKPYFMEAPVVVRRSVRDISIVKSENIT